MAAQERQIWTIGAGKGGVGKSFLTASLGTVLAQMGKSVIVADAALGSTNLHTFLGIKSPTCTVLDILENRASLTDGLMATAQPGLRLISCAAARLGTANPTILEKEEIIRFLSGLDADHVLVDLGAGTSFDVLDLFNLSGDGIVVTVPDPASLQNAYGFIKNAIYRRIQQTFGSNYMVTKGLKLFGRNDEDPPLRTMMDFYDFLCTSEPLVAESVAAMVERFQPLVVINMAASEQDQKVAEILQAACKKYLNVDIRFTGLIVSDPAVRNAVNRMVALDFAHGTDAACAQIRSIVARLLNITKSDDREAPRHPVPMTPTMGLNDNLEFMGKQLHIQTEDLGFSGRCITTQVFCNGRVILSTKSEYPAPLCDQTDRSSITDLMRRQHFSVIQELESKKAQIIQTS